MTEADDALPTAATLARRMVSVFRAMGYKHPPKERARLAAEVAIAVVYWHDGAPPSPEDVLHELARLDPKMRLR